MARRTPRTLAGSKGRIRLVTGAAPTTAPTTESDGEEIDADTPNPSRWLVKIRASVPASPATISGATIYVYDDNMWYQHTVLNGGEDIIVGDQGYCEVVEHLSVGTRVDLSGSAVTANIEVILLPLIEIEI